MDKCRFRNRESLLTLIVSDKETPILNLYGESGIGKSRLLEEAENQIIKQYPKALVLKINLSGIALISTTDLKKEKILELLVDQLQGLISQFWAKKYDQAVGQLVADLLTGPSPVYLFFDTTETIQEETSFWAWLEEYLIGPLVVRGGSEVKQIFAGRMPAPFQRHEIRRSLKLIPLEPLPVENEARQLIIEILSKQESQVSASELNEMVDFILSFSFGHPGLSIELADFLARQFPVQITKSLKKQVYEQVVNRYVRDTLLEGIDEEWAQILRFASILDWFDPYILRKFTEALLPQVAAKKTEAFYIQGIALMRRRKSIIWSDQQGDRLHGILREIIRRLIQVEGEFQPDEKNQYRAANLAAAAIIADLKQQAIEAGDTDIQSYDQEIQKYEQRAKG